MMNQNVTIQAAWDSDAGVWIATSTDVPGLVVEGETWPAMIDEVTMVLPDLLEIAGQRRHSISLTFKAETHLNLVDA